MDHDPLAPLQPEDRLTGDVSTPPPPESPAAPETTAPDTAPPQSTAPAPASWMLGDAPAPPPPATAIPTFPTIDPSPSSTPKPSGARKGFTAIVAAIAALFGVFAVKFIIGFLVAGAAASAIGAVFGGPWEHLPSSTRDNLNQRVEAALGDDTSGLSDSEKSAKLFDMGDRGLSRLTDETLIRRITLYKIALEATDEATCAAILRSSMKGPVSEVDSRKLIGAFTTEQFGEWAEIWVQALEAEAKGAPPTRTVSDADSSAMFDAVFSAVSDEDVATIQSLSDGKTVTDTVACQANRALYTAGLGLDDAKLAAFALTDVAP